MFGVLCLICSPLPRSGRTHTHAPSSMMMSMVQHTHTFAHSHAHARIKCLLEEEKQRTLGIPTQKNTESIIHHGRACAGISAHTHTHTYYCTQDVRILSTLECPLITRARRRRRVRPSLLFSSAAPQTQTHPKTTRAKKTLHYVECAGPSQGDGVSRS